MHRSKNKRIMNLYCLSMKKTDTFGVCFSMLFPSAAGFEGGRFAVLYGKIETVVLLG